MASIAGVDSTPVSAGQIEAPADSVSYSAQTNDNGELALEDGNAGVRIRIRTENAVDERPLPGILIYWGSHEQQFVVVAVDQDGRYLPAARRGTYDELRGLTGSPHLASLSGKPSNQVVGEVLLVLALVQAIETINSARALAEYLADWPDIVAHASFSGWYSEYCMTGAQLANLVDGAGLLIPGGVGEDVGAAVLSAIIRHNAGEAVSDRLTSLEGRHRFRIYATPFPVPFFTYEGRCDDADQPIPGGSPSETITPGELVSAPGKLEHQGEQIAYIVQGFESSSIELMSLGDGITQTIVVSLISDLSWSLEGSALLYVEKLLENGASQVVLVDLESMVSRIVIPAARTPIAFVEEYYQYKDPRFAPDGSIIYLVIDPGRVWMEMARSTLSGESEWLLAGGDSPGRGGLDVSPTTGLIAYQTWTNAPLYESWPGADGLSITSSSWDSAYAFMPLGHAGIADPAWSPDGKKLAVSFAAASDPSKAWYILVNALDLSPVPQEELAHAPGYMASHPSWSPDGRWIAFVRQPVEGGASDIWIVSTDTGEMRALTGTPDRSETNPVWRPSVVVEQATPSPTIVEPALPSASASSLSDGSTLVLDPAIGYSLLLPPGWVAANLISEEEWEEELTRHALALVDVVPIAEADSSDDQARLLAVLLDDNILATGAYPTIFLYAQPSEGMSLEQVLEEIAASDPDDGGTILARGFFENGMGVSYGRLDVEHTAYANEGIVVRSTLVLVRIGEELITLLLGAEKSAYPLLSDSFESVIASLRLTSR